ncbi:hypothetical protein BRARA_A03431 [Brassica rapa]|uniref:Cytosolic endo-beta-N-acetylglucosaminidase TIM barrel domain-containing protein n=1 Tax=Brassica campestris TaxID=3711 RepID=A0A398ASV2_BRACM|nr:hypothetical protein BRARA_A03431 [Brassica rapa]
MRGDLLRAYFSRRTLVSLYNLFFTISRKLLTSFPLSLIMPKSNDGDARAESESTTRCENDAGFAIWHWYLMDVFVYFSHSLVTIPPPCWTNTAHRHGIKESAQMYAERLAELSNSLGFDGWLILLDSSVSVHLHLKCKMFSLQINIENEIDKEQVPNLMEFVSHLTKVLHLSTPGSLIIWYDSVTVHGHLKWQDHLNEKNKPFFDLCDGIFMNYTWKVPFSFFSLCFIYMHLPVI